jgi:FAD:protein FMN transferase
MNTHFVRQSQRAMGTRAEVQLFGNDVEHLRALAAMAFAEIDRVEQLLSRFDPTSELSRINREAAAGECLIDFEMLEILSECRAWWLRTDGAFDIAAGSRDERAVPLTFDVVDLHVDQRTIRFRIPGARLDLGGYGKGYALDCVARLMLAHGVQSALLDLGSSSFVAIGSPPESTGWRIVLPDEASSLDKQRVLELCDAAMSTSSTWHCQQQQDAPSDLIEPRTGQPINASRSCTVIATKAAVAEAISTAFVVVGRDRALDLLSAWQDDSVKVIW